MREHFKKAEFACRHCGELPPQGMSEALLDGLEELRSIVKQPVHITSGYRCAKHNYNIGALPNSQHVKGTACDIYVEGYNVSELAEICKGIFDGVGEYYEEEFVHVDMRDEGKSTGYYLWTDED